MPLSLLCPVCHRPLSRCERTLVCEGRHSFDLARRGYVNLLTGHASAVGDNREMIAARRRFLDGGYYAPLRRALTDVAARLFHGGAYLDAGCGEGYYTEALAKGADGCVGIDISKDALALAAKRLPTAELAVASAYHLPLADASVSLLSCIFAPLAAEEFHRVLTQDGTFLYVIPDARHLYEMKCVLYDTPYENEVASCELSGFTPIVRESVRFPLSLPTGEAIADLFSMTPYYYRTPRSGRERLASLPSLDTHAEFLILGYRKD